MRHPLCFCLAVLSGVWFAFAAPKPAMADARPLVFAAVSLAEALRDIAETLEPAPRLSFGGSGAMARQISQGAPADLVMLADPDWMDWLDRQGRVLPGTRSEPLSNRLVLVGPPGAAPLPALTPETVLERLGPDGRIAIGAHRAVPAGRYAALWLSSEGLWDIVLPRLAETENVRAALALVSRGEVPLAVVYASDLIAAPEAATPVWDIPSAAQPAIRYSFAALTPLGRETLNAFTTPDARAIFARYGFIAQSTLP